MKTNIPNITVTEDDASRLIALYGNKPAPEKRSELLASLGSQKERFIQEHEHQKSRDGRSEARGR